MKKTKIRVRNTRQQKAVAVGTTQVSELVRIIPNHYRVKRT